MKTLFEYLPRNAIVTKVITTFLSLILTLNNFNCKKYMQIKSCGTISVQSCTNIFMNHFERKNIFPFKDFH